MTMRVPNWRFTLRTFFISVMVLCAIVGERIIHVQRYCVAMELVQQKWPESLLVDCKFGDHKPYPWQNWLRRFTPANYWRQCLQISASTSDEPLTLDDLQKLTPIASRIRSVVVPTSFSDNELRLLCKWQHLRGLDLSHSKITDDGLRAVARLSDLEWLSLTETGASDLGVRMLSSLRNVTSIDLSNTSISDVGVSYIVEWLKLEELDLSETNVGDQGILLLHNLPKLTDLKMRRTSISDDCIHGLRGLPLKFLDLQDISALTDQSMAFIAQIKNLRVLNIAGTLIGDEGVSHLDSESKIQWLFIDRSRITNEAITYIRRLPNLNWLSASECNIDDEVVDDLKQIRTLVMLQICETRISEEGFNTLRSTTKASIEHHSQGNLRPLIIQSIPLDLDD